MYNEFQWHWRLVLSEEQAGSLPRPDDKQTHPPNCNKTGREGCSLVGRCSLSLSLSISLALLSDSLPSSCFLSLFSQLVSLSTPTYVTPLLCSTPSPSLLIPFSLSSIPLSFYHSFSHPPPLCSGSKISRLCTAGARTSVLLAASYVAH